MTHYVCRSGCCTVTVERRRHRNDCDKVTINGATASFEDHAARLRRNASTIRARVSNRLCLDVDRIEQEQKAARRSPLSTNDLANRFLLLPRVTV
jgi:hypothetical protein